MVVLFKHTVVFRRLLCDSERELVFLLAVSQTGDGCWHADRALGLLCMLAEILRLAAFVAEEIEKFFAVSDTVGCLDKFDVFQW